jgi:acyl dehydratase
VGETGQRVGPFEGSLDADRVRRFGEATNDPSPQVQAGEIVPSIAVITLLWEAQNASLDELVPADVRQTASGGVHGEHDVVVHRPLVVGEPLRTWVERHGVRPAGRNSLVTLRYVTLDAGDELVAEQFWTSVWFNTTCEPAGEPAPEHTFPDGARDKLVGAWHTDVDDEMARRYAQLTGDWSAHHFYVEAARRSGFERVFLHGLCTMALCARGVSELVADGQPARIGRVAVRFSSPTFLGEQLRMQLYEAGPKRYAFEAECAGATVITHGRAEIR